MEQTAEVLKSRPRRRFAPLRRPSSVDPERSVISDYWELVKPEISFLVTISALAGFILGSPDAISVPVLGLALGGTALCAAGAGVFNHLAERRHDALMRRTANRPLPSGRVSPAAALRYGAILLALGFGLLWMTNLLTLLLALLTVVLYLAAYTPMKRRTPYNTLVGTIPGALPALGGYTAATGALGAVGWALFAILALWQIPHFLSLAWMYRKDYARAQYAMLTVKDPGGTTTARQTLGATAVLRWSACSRPCSMPQAGFTWWVRLRWAEDFWFPRMLFSGHAARKMRAASCCPPYYTSPPWSSLSVSTGGCSECRLLYTAPHFFETIPAGKLAGMIPQIPHDPYRKPQLLSDQYVRDVILQELSV